MEFSNRIKSISQSPIREFAPISAKARKEGKKVYALNIGQPDIPTPKEYFDAIKNCNQEVLAYTHSAGIPEVLEAFSSYYKRNDMDFNAKDILITNGGSEAILFSYLSLCDYGDEILVFEPYYANYNIFAKQAGAKIVAVTTSPEDDFKLPSKEKILEKISDKTKIIAVTNPNNPTGMSFSEEEVNMICDIAIEKGIYILADEVYREFMYESCFFSFANVKRAKEHVILVDSASKRFSACGARIGCLASKNKEFIAHALKLCQARLCVPYVEQIGAAALLDIDDSFILSCKEEYKLRRDTVYNALAKIKGINVTKPHGAFYFIVKIDGIDAKEFAKWILGEFDLDGETILLCPAKEFYASKDKGWDEIRIAYTINQLDLKKAMRILDAGLKEYKRINLLEEKREAI